MGTVAYHLVTDSMCQFLLSASVEGMSLREVLYVLCPHGHSTPYLRAPTFTSSFFLAAHSTPQGFISGDPKIGLTRLEIHLPGCTWSLTDTLQPPPPFALILKSITSMYMQAVPIWIPCPLVHLKPALELEGWLIG